MGRAFTALLYLLLPVAVLCKDYFTAAVFEHRERAKENDSPREVISKNLKFYESAAGVAVENGVDILVFNEYGLHPHYDDRNALRKFMEEIPDPRKVTVNPCLESKDDQSALRSLSCLARNNNIYLVANMGSIQSCDESCDAKSVEGCSEKCPDDGAFLYNTDVVFNREGSFIARYHKVHPYFENVNIDDVPDFVTFETEFGKFGLIVCFDSNFHEAVHLAKDFDIDTLLFPTYWFDDILPLNAVEFQQAWALANDVNFLAANTQTPGTGSLGSGIYSKKDGALVYTYEPDGESKLLIANIRSKSSSELPVNPSVFVIRENEVVRKEETGERFPEQCYEKLVGLPQDIYVDYRCFKSQTENYTIAKLQKSSGEVEACNHGFCCSLEYSAENIEEDFYLAVFSGNNNAEGYYQWCQETCLLVRCDPFEDKPCALQPSRSKTVFNSLKLRAEFKSDRVYATVSKDRFRLAPKSEWKYKRSGSTVTLKFETSSRDPLLKAALMGRCYEQDPPFVPWYRI